MTGRTATKKANVTKNSKAFPSKQRSENATSKTLGKLFLFNEIEPFSIKHMGTNEGN